MKLGIVYYNGYIVSHRSIIKVLFNPILRRFGYYIGTELNDDYSLGKPRLCRCLKQPIQFDLFYTNPIKGEEQKFDYIHKNLRIFI
jgi:hypothetical protein